MAECGGGGALQRVIMRPSMAAEVTSQRCLEFHPVMPERWRDREERMGGSIAYIGIASVFRKAGSVQVLRRAEQQLSMRYLVGGISSR